MYAGIHVNGYVHITFSSEDVFICMQMDIVTLPSESESTLEYIFDSMEGGILCELCP